MIDTSKYEGHTPAPWMNLGSDANSLLIQDAPLLLAEVKRLREDNELYLVCINTSAYKHEPRSAFRELDAIRQSQGRQREHVGALRCIYGKSTQSYLKEVEE